MDDETEPASDRYRAPALDKGLDILELLAEHEDGLSQAEIAKSLERTPNENYRMLDRLVRRGYVARNPADRYELTLKLFALAHRHPPVRRLVAQAMPPMRRFAREARQACHLAVYDGGAVVVVAQVDAPGYWGLGIRVGSHVSLLNTGSGHILLAFAAPQERALMLEEREVMPRDGDPGTLAARLEKVRERGYEMMPSLQIRGVTNIAVPIAAPGGGCLGALSCPHLRRLDDPHAPSQTRVLTLLREASAEIVAGPT